MRRRIHASFRYGCRDQACSGQPPSWQTLDCGGRSGSAVFLIYAASIGRALPIAPSLQTRTVVVNLPILIVYGLLIRADAVRPRMITSVIRDWLPLAVIIRAYREVGFALPYPGHRLEMR